MLHLGPGMSGYLHFLSSPCHRLPSLELFATYSWLNGCCNCTLVVVSFTYSTVDFISSRKDLFYSSIRDKLLSQFSTNRHSSIDNLNYYCLHLVQGTSHTIDVERPYTRGRSTCIPLYIAL